MFLRAIFFICFLFLGLALIHLPSKNDRIPHWLVCVCVEQQVDYGTYSSPTTWTQILLTQAIDVATLVMGKFSHTLFFALNPVKCKSITT